jgi:hypothetical protein
MRGTAALLVLLVINCEVLQAQQAHPHYSQAFLKDAITTIDAIDAEYKSVLNHDPDAIFSPLQASVQTSMVSLRSKASSRRERNFLKLLYPASSVIDMMRRQGNDSADQFPRETGIVVQCSTEARLKVDRDSIAGKLPKDFKPGQCHEQMAALVRTIE